jgi:hypothetical protein
MRPGAKSRRSTSLLDRLLGEASWLLSHAEALADYGRREEAAAELARAATCEEQVACLLEADGQELKAANHRVSAASCHLQLGQYTRAVTLLRAALSSVLSEPSRADLERLLSRCLAQATKELRRASPREGRKQSPAAS